MVDQRLVDYARGLLKKGYSVQSIRTQLISHGYTASIVDEAINAAAPHKHTLLLFGIVGAVLLIVGIIVAVIALTSGPAANIVLTLTPGEQNIKTGETLTFDVRLKNTINDPTGIRSRYDIYKNEELVQRQTDALTIRGEHTQKVQLPLTTQISPGTYELRTIIEFDSTTKQDKFTFTVEQSETKPSPPSASLDACDSCNDFNACTTDTCENGRCVHKPIQNCCGDGICESGESVLSCSQDCQQRTTSSSATISSDALELAKKDKQLAAQECAKIALPSDHDNCFSTLSEQLHDKLFCTPIFNIERRDACYLQFALEDPSVCTNIIDARLQQTCLQYGRYAALSATQ